MTRSSSSNFTAKVNVWSLLSAGRLLGAEIFARDVLDGIDTQNSSSLGGSKGMICTGAVHARLVVRRARKSSKSKYAGSRFDFCLTKLPEARIARSHLQLAAYLSRPVIAKKNRRLDRGVQADIWHIVPSWSGIAH